MTAATRKAKTAIQFCGSAIVNVPTGGKKKVERQRRDHGDNRGDPQASKRGCREHHKQQRQPHGGGTDAVDAAEHGDGRRRSAQRPEPELWHHGRPNAVIRGHCVTLRVGDVGGESAPCQESRKKFISIRPPRPAVPCGRLPDNEVVRITLVGGVFVRAVRGCSSRIRRLTRATSAVVFSPLTLTALGVVYCDIGTSPLMRCASASLARTASHRRTRTSLASSR